MTICHDMLFVLVWVDNYHVLLVNVISVACKRHSAEVEPLSKALFVEACKAYFCMDFQSIRNDYHGRYQTAELLHGFSTHSKKTTLLSPCSFSLTLTLHCAIRSVI